MANNTAVLRELRSFSMEQREVPKPKPHHVIIRTHTVGICGSDVHYWAHGKCGPFEIKGPIVLGHETSGVVDSVGQGVTNVKPGDRVAIEPGTPCSCREGAYNLCADIEFLATPPFDGSLCQYFEHPADFCFPMPDHMSFEEGALLEPLSVAVHACKRANIQPGAHVLITGAGPIGLVVLLVARASGATKIAVMDVMPNRLEVAKKLGADLVVLGTSPDVVDQLKAMGPIHQTFECSGAEPAVTIGIRVTTQGGKVVCIGRSAKPTQNIPLFEAADKEIDIIGSFRYCNTYTKALELVASGRINVAPLVTHHFDFAQTQNAFELAESGKDGAIKVVIHMPKAE